MAEEEFKQRLENLENRVAILEGARPKESKISNKNYKGLAGGIRFLIDNNFFNEPKTTKEIMIELKREGYHYTISGVASTLSETFMKSQKILIRINDKSSFKYVLRK